MVNVADWQALGSDGDIAAALRELNALGEAVRARNGDKQFAPRTEDALSRFLQKPFGEFATDDLIALHGLVVCASAPPGFRRMRAGVRHNPTVSVEFAKAEEIPMRVKALLNFLPQSDAPVPLRAALAHAELTDIHPFANGNGRTARLWSGILLIQHDYPPFACDEAAQAEYITTLANYTRYRTLKSFARFFLRTLAARMRTVVNAEQP